MRTPLITGLQISRQKARPLHMQLVDGLKVMIHSGALGAGHAIPSSRALAQDLGLSRNTVMVAFDQLASEGYLSPAARSGWFVSSQIVPLVQMMRGDKGAAPLRRRESQPRLGLPALFRPCQPDVQLFPTATWNRMRGQALRRYGVGLMAYQSQFAMGLPALQKALARYLRDSRGVRCEPEQVAVTSGSQQALFMLAQLLVREERRPVFLEDPCYPGARSAFAPGGAGYRSLAVDEEGLIPPPSLPAGAVVYTTPSRQFPTGATLPIARRLALLSLAAKHNAWIIEDDYDSEFRYRASPVPSLHSLDGNGRVIYVGTTSKVLSPALRLGYAVLPASLCESFLQLRHIIDDHGPLHDQAALAEFIENGSFYSHIRRCRRIYASRMEMFVEHAAATCPDLSFSQTNSGINLCATWKSESPANEELLSQSLAKAGIGAMQLQSYCLKSTHHGLVFGAVAAEPQAIKDGWARIASALKKNR
jgi:GntR family transcriptional regulator / MocR family aminotransferase